jgi:hypothetical protein
VPAAAVIPAPIVYAKVVAVKTLVVELWHLGRVLVRDTFSGVLSSGGSSNTGSRHLL